MINALEISHLIKGKLYGDKNLVIKGLCDIEVGKKDHLSFIRHSSYKKFLKKTKASLIIVDQQFILPENSNKSFIVVDKPSLAFISMLNYYSNSNKIKENIHKTSIIHKNAKIGKGCFIGPYVVINKNVIIKDNVIIKGSCILDDNSYIGANTFINYNVTISHDILVGKNCYIDSGTVIGSDGFGTIKDKGKHLRIPHIGKVIIKDDVLIGSANNR